MSNDQNDSILNFSICNLPSAIGHFLIIKSLINQTSPTPILYSGKAGFVGQPFEEWPAEITFTRMRQY